MAFSSWRGMAGIIHPTLRPGPLEEFIRLLPEGIGVLPLFANIRRGTREEFASAIDACHRRPTTSQETSDCSLLSACTTSGPPVQELNRAAVAATSF